MGTRMEALIVGAFGVLTAAVVQAIGYWFNRKSGLSEAQEAYQGVLEGMNKTMTSRVSDLEKQVEKLVAKNEALETKVQDLEGQVRELTRENLDLSRRLLEAGVKA